MVKNAKRSDGGQYRLQLRNSSGFDTATVNVKVLDRPYPPQNLHADEFGGDALTLFWNPPKDNGGADITNYVVERREPKGSWSKVCSLKHYFLVLAQDLIPKKIKKLSLYLFIYFLTILTVIDHRSVQDLTFKFQ